MTEPGVEEEALQWPRAVRRKSIQKGMLIGFVNLTQIRVT